MAVYVMSVFQYCASCHKEDGTGSEQLFPPLAESQKVTGSKEALITILLNGLSQPAKQNSQQMPAFSFLKDHELASILTYVRVNFGNKAGSVSTEDIKARRN